MDNDIDRKIDVTAKLFLFFQNRQQTHEWTLIGSGANGLGIQEENMLSGQWDITKKCKIFSTDKVSLLKLYLGVIV